MNVLIISGGSKGLGLAMVEHRLRLGDSVATFARSRTPAIDALAAGPDGERFLFEEADISHADAMAGLVRGVTQRFGRLDGLVNNAGIAKDGLLVTQSLDDIDQLLNVNLRGTLALTRSALRPMLRARRGRVINISSIIGVRGYRGLATYGATKGAMDAMTRALAREVGEVGITVNSIAPGYLETEMTHGLDADQMKQIARRTPLQRLGRPSDVLPVLDFLLSDGAGYITGQVLVVDGGITC